MSEKVNDSGVVELTGKILVVAIIVLFLVVAFVFFLHLYAKWFWYRREDQLDGPHRRRRRRSDFSGGHEELTPAAILRRGLDATALKSIPVVQFDPKDFKDGLECAVCLSELNEGEKTRILPKCNHGFHVECIDMWFQSHSTCPICRNSVSDQSAVSTEVSLENLLETPAQIPTDFPTNVLFWGNEVRVNSGDPQLEDGLYQSQRPAASLEDHQPAASSTPSASSSSLDPTCNGPDGVLAIDIPRQINEDEDQKSPITSRMMSFKRLFGRDKRVNPSSSPSNEDVEQGGSRSQNQHY